MPVRFRGAVVVLSMLCCCGILPGSAFAQADSAAKPMAERIAGPFRLTSADGERRCDLVLATQTAGAGLALTRDGEGCAAIAFVAQVRAWMPDASGAVLLLDEQGRTVAEFTEATGGSYEALREGDGVYFLGPPAVESPSATVDEVVGEWVLARAAGTPVCRWTLTGTALAPAGYRVEVAPGCEPSIARFVPERWELAGGNILIRGAADGGAIRFARQEDGTWARVPERNRPLLMTRP